MTRAWYHIVVVGTDLAGLIFAALAARQGYRVCVIGQADEPSRYRVDGTWFLRERELFAGVGCSPAVSRVFSELALGLELKNRPQTLEPVAQLAMPRVRLDFSREHRILEREFDREFPGWWDGLNTLDADARATAALFDPLMVGDFALPPEGFGERMRFRQHLRAIDPHLLDPSDHPFAAHIAHPGLQRAAQAIVDHFSGLGAEALPRHIAMRLWRAFRDGIYRFPGGLDGLKAMFIRKLQDQSGDYRPDALGIHLDIKRHRAVAVGLAERGEGLGCEMLVLNASPDRIGPLVGASAEAARAHRVIVNIAVDPRVIPASMAPELLLFGDDPTEGSPHTLGWWVSRPGAGPHTGTEGRPGPGVIQLSTTTRGHRLPALLEDPTFLRAEALRALRTIIPWLDDGLRIVDVPPPRPLLQHLDPDAAFALGSPWPSLPLSNVLATAGGHVNPLGLEGACLSALVALLRLRRRLKIKGGLPHARS